MGRGDRPSRRKRRSAGCRRRGSRSPRHRPCASSGARAADRRCRARANRHGPANSNGSFRRGGGAQRALALRAKEPRGFDDEERAQPFAAAKARIADRLKQAGRTRDLAGKRRWLSRRSRRVSIAAATAFAACRIRIRPRLASSAPQPLAFLRDKPRRIMSRPGLPDPARSVKAQPMALRFRRRGLFGKIFMFLFALAAALVLGVVVLASPIVRSRRPRR